MKKVGISLLTMIYLIIGLNFSLVTFAETTEQSKAFHVDPIFPSNQRVETTSYFDLLIKPYEPQSVAFNIVNNTNEEKKFSLAVLNGVTTNSGTISYDLLKKYDETIIYKLSGIASVQNEAVVAPNQALKVNLVLVFPPNEFKGILLGGIKITEIKNDETSDSAETPSSCLLPIKLRESEEKVPYKINFKGINTTKIEDKRKVKMKLQNPQPVIFRNGELETKLYTKNKKKLIAEKRKKPLKFAPNTSFSLDLYLGNKPLKAGNYEVEMNLTAGKFKQTWTESISFDKAEVNEINRGFTAVIVEKAPVNYWGIGSLLLIVVLILVLLVMRKKRMLKKAANSKRRKKRKRKKRRKKKD